MLKNITSKAVRKLRRKQGGSAVATPVAASTAASTAASSVPANLHVSGLPAASASAGLHAGEPPATLAPPSLHAGELPAASAPASLHAGEPQSASAPANLHAGEPPAASTPATTPPTLWEQAYDLLRTEEPDLVAGYERLLSRELAAAGPDPVDNVLAGLTADERRAQMDRLLKAGLGRTAKMDKANDVAGDVIGIVLSVKEAVGAGLTAVPVAAAAWTGVCAALQILTNPVKEATAKREGVVYVVRRMKWYSSLARLLEDDAGADSMAQTRQQLTEHIRDLYKKLLQYLVRSVCAYWRSRGLEFLKDLVKLNDWSGSLDGVKTAEESVQKDLGTFDTHEASSYLKLLTRLRLAQAQNDMVKACHVADMDAEIEALEARKDQLLDDAFHWILDTGEYQSFIDWSPGRGGQVLWIEGSPGKGKTMLLIGVVRDLAQRLQTRLDAGLLAYFFCQATDNRLNTAAAVVKSLIWMLLRQERKLVRHLEATLADAGPTILADPNAFFTLKEILRSMLKDPVLRRGCLVVDALDEVQDGRSKLPALVTELAHDYPNVRWLVSSRANVDIGTALADSADAGTTTMLSLDTNTGPVAAAVEAYISYKMDKLEVLYKKRYRSQYKDMQAKFAKKKDDIAAEVRRKAGGTFLWVALVFKQLEMEDCNYSNGLDRVNELPSGLDDIYDAILRALFDPSNRSNKKFKSILRVVVTAYRPLHLAELVCLAALAADDVHEDLVRRCGLLAYNDTETTVSFVHLSARDYFVGDAEREFRAAVLPHGLAGGHRALVDQALVAMDKRLRRDLCNIGDYGCSMEDARGRANADSGLQRITYACVFWLDHLAEVVAAADDEADNTDLAASVYGFLCSHFLHWTESRALLDSLPDGIGSIQKLLKLSKFPELDVFLRDAERFLRINRPVIEEAPLHLYASALVFCPTETQIREKFWEELAPFLPSVVGVRRSWDACRQVLHGHTRDVLAVAISPDGQTLASGSEDETVRIWDAETGHCRHTLVGHSNWVRCVAFAPVGQTLASGSEDETVRIWDAETGHCRHTLTEHTGWVRCVAFAPDGQTLASGSDDNTVRIWDAETGHCRHTLTEHTDWVRCVAFAPDGQTLASGSDDKTVRIWDVATGTHHAVTTEPIEYVVTLAFAPDRSVLAAADKSAIAILDAKTGELLQTLATTQSAESIRFDPDSQTMLTVDSSLAVRSYDCATWHATVRLAANISPYNVAFSADGRTIVAAVDRTVQIWDLADSHGTAETLSQHTEPVADVVFSPDGTVVASAANDGTVRLWDAATGDHLHTLFEPVKDARYKVAFSPDSTMLAAAAYNRPLSLWNVVTGTRMTARPPTSTVQHFAFAPDGATLATSNKNGIQLWDVHTGELARTIFGAGPRIIIDAGSRFTRSLAFTPDGATLAAGDTAGNIRLWDSATGKRRMARRSNGRIHGPLRNLAFAPDGRTLASLNARLPTNALLRLWDVASGVCRRIWVLTGNPYMDKLAFSVDGRYVVTPFGRYPLTAAAGEDEGDGKGGEEGGGPELDHGLYLVDGWIVRNGRRVVLLPRNWEVESMEVRDDCCVLGLRNGQVVFLYFKDEGAAE